MEHEALLGLARRRGIFTPAYEIYGGVAGLYEYGPVGARLKYNLERLWRRHYVAGEGYLEIDAPLLAPEKVWEASGHLGEFDDALTVCGRCSKAHRADQLLEGVVPNPDALSLEELDTALADHRVTCPACGGPLGRCRPFNLMFASSLGAGTGRPVYLRPETAQSIFVSFPALLRQARGKLPFGVAQVGRSFRNEIAPRQGLIRLREFTHAEVEYFVLPEAKVAPRFAEVADLKLRLVPNTAPGSEARRQARTEARGEGGQVAEGELGQEGLGQEGLGQEGLGQDRRSDAQSGGPMMSEGLEMTVGEAVRKGVILNQLVGYHVGRAYQFLLQAGLKPGKLRFRQHLRTEMAHYAADCWDGEALTSLGWIEIVGVADRGCYDLTRHQEHSGVSMSVPLPGRTEERVFIKPDKAAIGKRFKARAKEVLAALDEMESKGQLPIVAESDGSLDSREGRTKGARDSSAGRGLRLDLKDEAGNELCLEPHEFALEQKRVAVEVVPHVIEPSFGIDRIVYSVLSQAMEEGQKEGESYTRLKVPAAVAPYPLAVYPLQKSAGLPERAREFAAALRKSGLDLFYDDSRSIGRRYARADEIGIPWCLTVDHQSLEDDTVTLRDRDTTEQKRVAFEEVQKRFGGG